MNYGRYFRLNQALSNVENGIAIYDYMDLPAYFGPSIDNPMSPKYPISITITSDTVCFRLHYSAFKLEKYNDIAQRLLSCKKNAVSDCEKKAIIDEDFPRYTYDKANIDSKSLPKVDNIGLTNIGMAHMEEVILELPYNSAIDVKLSDVIKSIYRTTFPQIIDESTSMGGRFLERLIRQRYPDKKTWNEIRSQKIANLELEVEKNLYRRLRDTFDDTHSYSTLWLMSLITEYEETDEFEQKKNHKRIDLYDNTDINVIGFLRKLLLDFMFDLKHSDVFQNSRNYQQMYSGLMSDFYFSALLHKCEYYYYRDLTKAAIEKAEEDPTTDVKNNIKVLYASELFNAEELWIQDIMNPQAEKYFMHQLTVSESHDKGILRQLKNLSIKLGLIESDVFRNEWPSWFAEPEEEMRRVYFFMKEKNQSEGNNSNVCNKTNKKKISTNIKVHLCNSDTLTHYLNIDENDDMAIQSSINREIVSGWFLRRYDFNDVAHIHLSQYANLLISICILPLLIVLYFVPFNNLQMQYFPEEIADIIRAYMPTTIMLCIALLLYVFFRIYRHYEKKELDSERDPLLKTYFQLSRKRVEMFFGSFVLVLFAASNFYIFLLLLAIGCLLIYKGSSTQSSTKFSFYFRKLTAYLHLLLPRLVASITTAWLTMSMGFDLYNTFFDKGVSWSTAAVIVLIVFVFIMYGINKITPNCKSSKKILRSFELLLISYCIALIVGFIVVDFVGSQYLERGGFIEDFHKEYVYNKDSISLRSYVDESVKDDITKYNKVLLLRENESMVATFRLGNHEVFYMRNFLFMFSFVAMFIGIFLQMVLFEEKQMTEL